MLRVLSNTSKRLSRTFTTTTTAAAAITASSSVRSQLSNSHTSSSSSILLSSPWSATQLRFARFSGGDVKPGQVIRRKGKMYEIIKAHHTTQGRGGAIMQVELRDIDSGNKINERFRTDEALEKVQVQEKTFTYLYTDDESDSIVLMEPETYDQVDVPKHLFGETLPYLADDMNVYVQFYDDRPTSAKVPQRVTCTVVDAKAISKGASVQPQYKKVLLDNGLTVQVPSYVLAGEKIVVNTTSHSYMSRA